MKIEGFGSASGSGSITQRHGSADPDPDPDPYQNVIDPQHCFVDVAPLTDFKTNKSDIPTLLNVTNVISGTLIITRGINLIILFISYNFVHSTACVSFLSANKITYRRKNISLCKNTRTCSDLIFHKKILLFS